MKPSASDLEFTATPTDDDAEELRRINQAVKSFNNRAVEVATENHTRESVLLIESAKRVALVILDMPTGAHAKQAADSLENSGLPQLLNQARANGVAPQGALPQQPPANNQPLSDNQSEQIERLEAAIRTSERWRAELHSAAGLPHSGADDNRAHHDAVRAIQALRADAGPRPVVQSDPKDSQEYKDLLAEKQALQAQLDQLSLTHVPRTEVLAEAKKLAEVGPTFPRRTPNDEEIASEQARKALLNIGKPQQSQRAQQGQRRTPQPR